MALLTVFSDNLNPTTGSLSDRFRNATAFYIDAPLLTGEMEIDVFLQVYFPTATGERLRNLALGKLSDGQIRLNQTDTETVVPIPDEFIDSGLDMALFFLPSDPIFLEVYVLGADVSIKSLDEKIDELTRQLNDVETGNNNTDIILNLILNALGIPAPIISGTGGEQEFFLLQ